MRKVAVTREEIAGMARLTRFLFEGTACPPSVVVFARNEHGEICVSSAERKDGVILRAYRYMTRKQIKHDLIKNGLLNRKGVNE